MSDCARLKVGVMGARQGGGGSNGHAARPTGGREGGVGPAAPCRQGPRANVASVSCFGIQRHTSDTWEGPTWCCEVRQKERKEEEEEEVGGVAPQADGRKAGRKERRERHARTRKTRTRCLGRRRGEREGGRGVKERQRAERERGEGEKGVVCERGEGGGGRGGAWQTLPSADNQDFLR